MKHQITLPLLLLASGQVQAHSHPGIDSLAHSLEHVALSYANAWPLLAVAGLAAAFVAGIRRLLAARRKLS